MANAKGATATHELDEATVRQIRQLEAEADDMVTEADGYRLQAATLIVQLLDAGASERAVAEAIGKSDTHVHFAAAAWKLLQQDPTLATFNAAYKLAKKPPGEREEAMQQTKEPADGDNPAKDESAETAFPPWPKQMREFKRLSAEMVEQANLQQVRAMLKAIEKLVRDAATKEQELDSYDEK